MKTEYAAIDSGHGQKTMSRGLGINKYRASDGKSWYYDIQNYLERGELPEAADQKDRLAIQKLSSQFISVKGDVYKRQPNGI